MKSSFSPRPLLCRPKEKKETRNPGEQHDARGARPRQMRHHHRGGPVRGLGARGEERRRAQDVDEKKTKKMPIFLFHVFRETTLFLLSSLFDGVLLC